MTETITAMTVRSPFGNAALGGGVRKPEMMSPGALHDSRLLVGTSGLPVRGRWFGARTSLLLGKAFCLD
jgi:hypothetical protein